MPVHRGREVRVPREWVWVIILIAVLAITFLGCSQIPKTEEQRREDFIRGREAYYSEHFVEIEYKGHTYFYYSRNERMGIVHAGHCEGDHR